MGFPVAAPFASLGGEPSGVPRKRRAVWVAAMVAVVVALLLTMAMVLGWARGKRGSFSPLRAPRFLRKLLPRRAGSSAVSASPSTAPYDLTGPWAYSWTGNDDVQPLPSGSFKRLQVNTMMDAKSATLEARYLNVDALEVPASYVPTADDDMITHAYLTNLRQGRNVGQGIGVPRGTIILWTNPDAAPTGSWVPCDGREVDLPAPETGKIRVPDLRGVMLKGATAVGSSVEGSASVPLTAANLPAHTHPDISGTTWAEGTATKTTSAAGEHNHQPAKADFCTSWTQMSPTDWVCANADAGRRNTPFMIRSAKRDTTQANTRTAYTTQDQVGIFQTQSSAASPESTSHTHTHSVPLAHTHTLTNAGSANAALSIVPGHVFVGFYMRI